MAVNILIYQLLNECRISNMLILENHQDSLSFIPKFRITHIRSSGIQRIVKLCNKNECILLIAPHTQFSSYPRNVRFKINVFKNEKIKQLNFFSNNKNISTIHHLVFPNTLALRIRITDFLSTFITAFLFKIHVSLSHFSFFRDI